MLSNSRGPGTRGCGSGARTQFVDEVGEDADAKKVVAGHLDQIGYDSLDLGPLAVGWRTQPGTAAYSLMYMP